MSTYVIAPMGLKRLPSDDMKGYHLCVIGLLITFQCLRNHGGKIHDGLSKNLITCILMSLHGVIGMLVRNPYYNIMVHSNI
jgi:hypothetical protein